MVDARRDVRTRFIGQDTTGAAARSASRNVASVGVAYDRVSRQVQRTNQIIATATLGIGGSSLTKTAAELQNAQLRLSIYTRNLARDQEYLARTSQRLSIDLSSATDALARLRVLENAGAIGSGQSEEFLEGLTDVFTAFGASQGRQENVLYGLFQALGQGTVQAQELNQVIEPLPGLLNDLAEQAGVSAVEYRELVKSGELLSTTFGKDLFGVFDKYAGTAESAAGNIQQTLARLSNEYKLALIQFSEPLGKGITLGADVLISSIKLIAASLDKLVIAAGLYAAIAVGQFAGNKLNGVNAFTTGIVNATKKRIAATEAEIRAYAVKDAAEKKSQALAERFKIKDKVKEATTAVGATTSSVEQQKSVALSKEATRIKKVDLALEKELKAAQIKGSAEAAKAAEKRLAAELDALKSRKGLLTASESVAKSESAAIARNKELANVRSQVAKTEKALAAAQKATTRSVIQSTQAQKQAIAATENAFKSSSVNKARKSEIALEKEYIAVRRAGAADVAKAAEKQLESDLARLRSREKLLAADKNSAKIEAAAIKRTEALNDVKKKIKATEKEFGKVQRESAGAVRALNKAQEDAARATEAARTARAQELLAGRESVRLNKTLVEQQATLVAAGNQRVASVQRATAAQLAYRASLAATNVVMVAQIRIAQALAAAQGALNFVLGALGGPAGVAVLAGIALLEFRRRAKEAAEESVLGRLKTRLEEVNKELGLMARGLQGASEGTLLLADAEEELNKARKALEDSEATQYARNVQDLRNLTAAVQDSVPGFEALQRAINELGLTKLPIIGSVFDDVFNVRSTGNFEKDIENLTKLIDELIAKEQLLNAIPPITERYNQLGTSQAKIQAEFRRAALEAAGELAPAVDPIVELENRIEAIKLGQPFATSKSQVDLFTRALEAANEKMGELTGSTERQREKAKAAATARDEQEKFRVSLLSDELRVINEAKTEIEALEKRALVPDSGVSRSDVIEGTIARYAAMHEELIALSEARHDKELQQARDARDKMIQYRNELISATAVTDPTLGIQQELGAQLADLRTRLQNDEIKSIQDFNLLKEALVLGAAKKLSDRLAEQERAAFKQRQDQERALEQKKSEKNDKIDATVFALGGVIENFKSDAGEFIQITDDMTAAERKAAERSNAINERRFEKNKKLRTAQAIIDTYAGANRALAEEGWMGIARAAGIIAFGIANVRKIQAESFGGSAAAVSSTSGARLDSNDQRIDNTNAPVNITQWIVTADELVDREKFQELASHAVADATQSRRLQFDTRNNAYRVAS